MVKSFLCYLLVRLMWKGWSGLHLPKNQKRLPSFVIQSVLFSILF